MITTKWSNGESDLKDVHFIRREVFINEQGVSEEEEMDNTDAGAIHLVAYDGERPVATGRILMQDGICLLGRIAVLKEERRKKYGDLIMRMLIRKAYGMGQKTQYIHAQLQAVPFYRTLGFTAFGEEYLDAGIPHISMSRDGDIGGEC